VDYTTLARTKSELHSASGNTTDDALLSSLITAASRAIDRLLTGTSEPGSTDYLTQATISNEFTRGALNNQGILAVYPHKVQINSISAMNYRAAPQDAWTPVPSNAIVILGPRVEAWISTTLQLTTRIKFTIPGRLFAQTSYTGGLANTPAGLPDDIQEVATMLTIRYYREAETGLQDSIGVAELAQLIYTKAWPVRALSLLQPYKRRVAWGGAV
jgi:hypothetical protein